jgi:hypothetical protein
MFNNAIAEHSRWKRKFRKQLATGSLAMLPSEVCLDDRCALGRWIYADGWKYSDLADYHRLKQAHAQFHLAAADLIRRANAGELVAEESAPCSQSKYSLASAAVIVAITDLKKRIGPGPF